ncbi:MAG: MBL fold metallo-hydrolase, partial [Clostridia bacterium]|nr:MBL fold metallo-hydrolase [Clostridia bacterium]
SYGQGLTREIAGEQREDDFIHEQYLLIEERGKRILISGCSHKGIENIMEWLKPDVLIGGFHFMKLEPEGKGREDLIRAAKNLSAHPTAYYTCHCTGEAPYAFLKERMGEQLRYIAAGDVFEI